MHLSVSGLARADSHRSSRINMLIAGCLSQRLSGLTSRVVSALAPVSESVTVCAHTMVDARWSMHTRNMATYRYGR